MADRTLLDPEERADLAEELENALIRARTHTDAAPHRPDV